MNNVSFANVIGTTRLLKHFDDTSLSKFKAKLFKQLKCANEQDFLCLALNQLYQSLSNDILSSLKLDAIKIAQSQNAPHKNSQSNSNDKHNNNNNNNKHYSLYDSILDKYSDNLSQLPSNTIDYLGSFLNKKESIAFGFLNKQLFMETQKQSYLLQRNNDIPLLLNMEKIRSLLLPQHNPFHYSLPKEIEINIDIMVNAPYTHATQRIAQRSIIWNKIRSIFESKWFATLFSRVNKISITDLQVLQYIPIETLFSNNNYYRYNNYSNEIIDCFTICGHIIGGMCFRPHTTDYQTFTQFFFKNAIQFINNLKTTKGKHLWKQYTRKINHLVLESHSTIMDSIFNNLAKMIMTGLSGMYFNLDCKDTEIQIQTGQEFAAIFHKDLKSIKLSGRSTLSIEQGVGKQLQSSPNLDLANNLECIGVSVIDDMLDSERDGTSMNAGIKNIWDITQLLNVLDLFDLRQSLECYIIVTRKKYEPIHHHRAPAPELDLESLRLNYTNRVIFNKFFFDDCVKTPLLRRIKIVITHDSRYMHHLIAIFSFLIDNKKKLLNNDSINSTSKIDTIEIEWCDWYIGFSRPVGIVNEPMRYAPMISGDAQWHNIFGYNKTKDISADKMIEEWAGDEMSEKSFGILYQNVLAWFNNIFNTIQDPMHANNPLDGRKLIIQLKQLKVFNIDLMQFAD